MRIQQRIRIQLNTCLEQYRKILVNSLSIQNWDIVDIEDMLIIWGFMQPKSDIITKCNNILDTLYGGKSNE
jgi:hypothetical protein